MHRLIVLFVVVALAPVPAALAQSSPFGPLPPAQPAATPTPESTPSALDDASVSRETLLVVALGVIALFAAIGIAVTRDARRSLTADDRAALERSPDEVSHAKSREAKQRARKKAKAQRQARRKNR